jgi:hypothetical protein
MNNVELFRKDKDDISNFNIWAECNKVTGDELKKFFDDVYNTVRLGEILYDNKYTELTKVIKRAMFLKVYNVIFSSFAKVGTYESLITVIKSVFGETAKIEFESSKAGVLEIRIGQRGIDSVRWVTKSGESIVSKGSKDTIIFQAFINKMSVEWALELFNQFLRPAGIHYEISIPYENN